MIATDGTPTVATASERIRSRRDDRKRTAILRAWYSALSAYPAAPVGFQVAEAAKAAHTTVRLVEQVLAGRSRFYLAERKAAERLFSRTIPWEESAQYFVTDVADDDSPGRANLH